MLRAAARRSEPSSALVNKLQFHCKAPLSLVLRPMQPSQRLATPIRRPRNSVSWPARPAAPARATARWTCQLAGAKMCWCRACAGPWKCVLECASWARRRCVCSRTRVHVCCCRRCRASVTMRSASTVDEAVEAACAGDSHGAQTPVSAVSSGRGGRRRHPGPWTAAVLRSRECAHGAFNLF